MNEKEIRDFITDWSWCTIVATDGEQPYAIEVSYVIDEDYIYCGSRPGGTMHTCLKKNSNVVLKICDADKTYETWRALAVRGKAEFISDRDSVLRILRMIAKTRGKEENAFDNTIDYILSNPSGSSLFRVSLTDITGVTRDTPL